MSCENNIMWYQEKKKNSTSSSDVKLDHKHNYVARFIHFYIFDIEHLTPGKRCSVCGKSKVTRHFILDGGSALGSE